MTVQQRLQRIQSLLQEAQLDGWLLYDFRRSNDLACTLLEIPSTTLLTRRFFYWIPQKGEPIKCLSVIEQHVLDHVPGKTKSFRSWTDLQECLKDVLKGSKKIAMEYSPQNAIPYVSKVDAGTVDLIRSFAIEVASSADLLQHFTSVWSEAQRATHMSAAEILDRTAEETWNFIARSLKKEKPLTEYDVQQSIIARLQEHGCVFEGDPICAVNENSANPHYSPAPEGSKIIQKGDWILIDLWAKLKTPHAIYADITRVAIAGTKPSPKQQKVFDIVREAQKKATDFVIAAFSTQRPVQGWEVDRVCRRHIEEAGFGPYFVHRTGHSIDTRDHGSGANLDDLETHDTRHLLPGTGCSVEPGIYLPQEWGIRLEYNLCIDSRGHVVITGGIQKQIKEI